MIKHSAAALRLVLAAGAAPSFAQQALPATRPIRIMVMAGDSGPTLPPYTVWVTLRSAAVTPAEFYGDDNDATRAFAPCQGQDRRATCRPPITSPRGISSRPLSPPERRTASR